MIKTPPQMVVYRRQGKDVCSNLNVIGSSVVTIMEGREIIHNNIATIKDGAPLSVGKLGVYLLSQADEFDLHAKTLTPVAVAEHEQEA